MRKPTLRQIQALIDAEAAHPTPRERPWATAVSYSPARDEIRLVLDSGSAIIMPRKAILELRGVPKSHLRELRLIGDGHALALDTDDVHIYVPGLVRDMTGYGAKALHPRQVARARRVSRESSKRRRAPRPR